MVGPRTVVLLESVLLHLLWRVNCYGMVAVEFITHLQGFSFPYCIKLILPLWLWCTTVLVAEMRECCLMISRSGQSSADQDTPLTGWVCYKVISIAF